MPAGGITFFPEGPAGGKRQSKLNIIKHEGIVWFYFAPLLVNDHQKLFYNGKEGWLAHQTNSLLFIKRYPDISYEQEAPGETEVELYIHKNRTYMELEIQGEYVSLSPKDTIVWKVCWFCERDKTKSKRMMSERMFYLTLGGWLMVKNDLFRLAGFFFSEEQSLE